MIEGLKKILLCILNNILEFLQSFCRVNVVYGDDSSSFGLYTKQGVSLLSIKNSLKGFS